MRSSKTVRVAIAMEQGKLLRRQTRRWEVLKTMYDAADADRSARINREDLEDSIGEIDDSVIDYLIQENLIESNIDWDVFAITHVGLLEVEQALRHEEQPTQHFPPLTVTLHNSSNVNIQIASPGAQAHQVSETSPNGVSQQEWQSDIKKLSDALWERLDEVDDAVWTMAVSVFKRLHRFDTGGDSIETLTARVESKLTDDERVALKEVGTSFRGMAILENLAAAVVWQSMLGLTL